MLPEFNAQLQHKMYQWRGFLATFENPPVLNETDAGNVQTFWFRLGGDHGPNVLAPGSPASRRIDCSTKAPLGPLVAAQTPNWASLAFQAYTGRYSYPWKPRKGNNDKGTCRESVLTLSNGSAASG